MISLLTTIASIIVVGIILWIILSVARSLIKVVVIVLVLLVLILFVGHSLNLLGDAESNHWQKRWHKEVNKGE